MLDIIKYFNGKDKDLNSKIPTVGCRRLYVIEANGVVVVVVVVVRTPNSRSLLT